MLLAILGGVTPFVLVLFAWKGWQSRTPPGPGLVNGKLRACPASPNCVCSEAGEDDGHRVKPLAVTDVSRLRSALEKMGGRIESESGNYLHATFTSALFRFVDDVELRADLASGVVHIRSASRVGHSDFGVNRKRVARLRRLLR